MSQTGGEAETVGECNQPNAVAVDADSIYCAGAQGMVRFRKRDNTVISHAESPDEFSRIALDEKNLYLIGVKGIYRVSKTAAAPRC